MNNQEQDLQSQRCNNLFKKFLSRSKKFLRSEHETHRKVRYPTSPDNAPNPYRALLSQSVEVKEAKYKKWVSFSSNLSVIREKKIRPKCKKRYSQCEKKQILCFPIKQKDSEPIFQDKDFITSPKEERKSYLLKLKRITDDLQRKQLNYQSYSSKKIETEIRTPEKSIKIFSYIPQQENSSTKPTKEEKFQKYEESLKRVKLKPIPKKPKQKLQLKSKLKFENQLRESIRAWTKYTARQDMLEGRNGDF